MVGSRLLDALDEFDRDELRVGPPPTRRWWDVPVAVLLAGLVVVELAVTDVPLPLVSGVGGVAIVALSLFRRVQPLRVAVGAALLDVSSSVVLVAAGVDGDLAYETPDGAATAALMIVYSVARWAPVRHIPLGLGVVAAVLTADAILTRGLSWLELLSEFPIWLMVVAVGIAVRYRRRVQQGVLEEARASEREAIARELHDMVAHHVSGIAVQAQAGQALAERDPERALGTLETIETSASTALEDMRRLVGILRAPVDQPDGDRDPQATVADLRRLIDPDAAGPAVELRLDDDVATLAGPVGATLFRVAQEAVTNARRHARQAHRVLVTVTPSDGEADPDTAPCVVLDVTDDGDPPSAATGPGYGLVGMRERVELLGGSLTAGPGPERGWQVTATIPIEPNGEPS